MRGYVTRHQLALRYMRVGPLEEAEAQWRQALAEHPRYMPALIGLGDVTWSNRRGRRSTD